MRVIEKLDAKAIYSDFGDSQPGVTVFAAIAVDPSTCGDMLPADCLTPILVIGRECSKK
jgi:hypothetical protein